MKLHFDLLWIEDSFSKQEEEEIASAAESAGFELQITNIKDDADIDQLAKQQQSFHTFDLILLDLKLAGTARGDQLAPRVRKLFRSTPILFYSGSDNEKGLRKRMAEQAIEGVFCTGRANFTTRAGELIQDYAHTLNRLSGMRGLAMKVVAEVDTLCRATVAQIATGDVRVEAEKFLNDAVATQSNRNLEDYPKLESLSLKLKHPATDSMKSFRVFREVLKKRIGQLPSGEEKDELSGLKLQTKTYIQDVLEIRNVLGHALEAEEEEGWSIKNRDGQIIMTVADFPRYRSDFLSHLRALRRISEILIAQN